ncbi:MAG: hypothetical protein KAS23_15495, partial [Anaerohalosphaera sp.]|nr:hypothetical protein [Anaerohalosphaera sp.]
MREYFQRTAVILIALTGAFVFGETGKSGQSTNAPASARQIKVIDITGFGVQPDSGKDAVAAVKQALAKAREFGKQNKEVHLVFPKGRYDFFPDSSEKRKYYESNSYQIDFRTCPIIIEETANLVFDGNGSEFVFHGPMRTVTIDNSENITLKNFSVDWDIPLTAQSQVMEVTDDYIDIRIADESPYIIENGKIFFTGKGWKSGWWATIEFEKHSHLVPQGSGDGCMGGNWRDYRAEEIKPRLIRLHNKFKRTPAVGNYLVMRHNSREHAGMFFFHSKDIVLEDVNVYHTGGLGLLGQFSENLSFERVNIIPNPAKNRYLSGHDDGLHISNCRGLVRVEDCTFGGLMDDPINVHGTSVRVIKQLADDKLLCRFMHSMSVGMLWGRPGEKVGFIRASSLKTISTGRIKSWKPLNVTDFEVSFEKAVPGDLKVGDALENLTWAPQVHISNCTFNSCRARGVLLSTGQKSIIEDSIFRSSGAAILIAGDANQWYESGAVNDLVIRGNIFESPCLTSWYQFGEGVI